MNTSRVTAEVDDRNEISDYPPMLVPKDTCAVWSSLHGLAVSCQSGAWTWLSPAEVPTAEARCVLAMAYRWLARGEFSARSDRRNDSSDSVSLAA